MVGCDAAHDGSLRTFALHFVRMSVCLDDLPRYSFEGTSGDLRWSFSTGGLLGAAPALTNTGLVIVGQWDGDVWAVNATTGARDALVAALHQVAATECPSFPNATHVDVLLGPKPRSAQRSIRIGAYCEMLTRSPPPPPPPHPISHPCIRPSAPSPWFCALCYPGAMVWKYSTRAYLSSSPCVTANNVVYFGSYNGNVLGLDASTGALLWSFPTGAYVVSSPAIGSDGTLFIGSGNGVLFALAGVLKCPCVSSTPSLPRALHRLSYMRGSWNTSV